MLPSDVEKNLLILIDPAGLHNDQKWTICNCTEINRKLINRESNLIICFQKKDFFYFIYYFTKLSISSIRNFKLYLLTNDWIIFSIFEACNSKLYREFSKKYVNKPKTLKQLFLSILPVIFLAETRYLVIFRNDITISNKNLKFLSKLEKYNYMFFSNPFGKIILANEDTFESHDKWLIKTTSNENYLPILIKEYETITQLFCKNHKINGIPQVGEVIKVNNRQFYTEKFIVGENLREKLRKLGEIKDKNSACNILDKIDEWYMNYLKSFNDPKISFVSLYKHLPILFDKCYENDQRSLLLLGNKLLKQLNSIIQMLTPIIAHNDLWPGNFIISNNTVTVIDWERATKNRAPFYDYFWMITSASIEWLIGSTRSTDYSFVIKKFLNFDDDVSKYSLNKLKFFLNYYNINNDYLMHFLYLLFMELSIQGFQIFNKSTKMDYLFYDILFYFKNRKYKTY